MTSTIGRSEFDYENPVYRPIITPRDGSIEPERTEQYTRYFMPLRILPDGPGELLDDTAYIIDTCIKVSVPSGNFRNEKVGYWQAQHGTATKWAWIGGSIAALFAAGVGTAIVYTTPYIAVALGVASIASMVFCGINIKNIFSASHQIKGWSASPQEKLAHERTKAYREGFPHVMSEDLKLQGMSHHQVLLPQEVQFLHEKHFDNFCLDHPTSEQEKTAWLGRFTQYNPVANAVLRYAHDGEVPDKYALVSADYEVLHRQLTNVRLEFTTLRRQRREETQEIIRQINENHNLAGLPFSMLHSYWINQATTERNAKLATATDPIMKNGIDQEYNAAMRKYNLCYAAATVPMKLFFDQQVADANKALATILATIKTNEASTHAPYFIYADGLLNHARQVKQNAMYAYHSQVFQPAQAFRIPVVPSAPPAVEINVFFDQARQQVPRGIDPPSYQEYLRQLGNPPPYPS